MNVIIEADVLIKRGRYLEVMSSNIDTLLPPSVVDCPLWQTPLRICILIGSLSLCVVLRAPDSAPLKSKMIYASSKDAIKKKLTGE